MLVRKAREFRGRISCEGLDDCACSQQKREAVDIHLILPGSSDKPIIDAVGSADFHEMLHLGIKVYRWDPQAGWSANKSLHTKAWVIDYEEGEPALTYVGSANATQRSHLADNEVGILTTSPDFARKVYERFFVADASLHSRQESAENFHVLTSTNAAVGASRYLRKLLVDLFWFF
jgi:phosphatidylserine/phosphatidylglycerophosphate/cardiolipin synthase-like enzyme